MLEALGLIPSIAWVMETYAYHPTTGMFRFIFCYIEFKASLGYVKLISIAINSRSSPGGVGIALYMYVIMCVCLCRDACVEVLEQSQVLILIFHLVWDRVSCSPLCVYQASWPKSFQRFLLSQPPISLQKCCCPQLYMGFRDWNSFLCSKCLIH